MSKYRSNGISISEKLSSVINTKPSLVESDDDDFTTVEKITAPESDYEYSDDEVGTAKLRRINEKLLEEEDNKYLGKGISRKELTSSIDSDLSEVDNNVFSDEETDLPVEDDGSEFEESECENEVSSESFEAPKKLTHRNKTKLNKQKSEEYRFNKEIFSKVASDIEKGKAIKNQLHIWDFLLECRMKFQKCLVASNKFPNYINFSKFKSNGGIEFKDSVNQSKHSLKCLLRSLLSLQEVLLKSNEDFLHSTLLQKGSNKVEDEIGSESGIDDDDDNKNSEKCKSSLVKNLKKLCDFSQEISKKHKNLENYRNSTIQKWNDKTKIAYINNKNFSAFEQSTLKQIEHVLLDKPRLIKRTQTKRSNYHILGQDDEPPTKKPMKLENENSSTKLVNKTELQKEIFDDDDFYHNLLSELVKRKANDVTDPVQLGRQWMQLQKIRSKMKKNVDVKASKGRKVRFVVHPKLVNFMMPINNSYHSEESRLELFSSLFGKK